MTPDVIHTRSMIWGIKLAHGRADGLPHCSMTFRNQYVNSLSPVTTARGFEAYLENNWLTKKGCPVFTLYWMTSFRSCSSLSWATGSADKSRSISFWSSSGALHSTTRLLLLVAWNTAFSNIRSTASFRNWECCCLSGRLANQGTFLVVFWTTYPGDGEREGTATSPSAVTSS